MIQNQVEQFIRDQNLIQSGSTILVGVSGGPDSVALLHILNALKYDLRITIHAAHVNHQLRSDADADEAFVTQLTDNWNIPLSTHTWTTADKNAKGSLEERARNARLSFFKTLIPKFHISAVALGHHKDDQAETVLINILRGSGMEGLQGIRPQRTVQGLNLIRPLLSVGREEIEDHLNHHNIDFRTDSSNSDPQFTRNKVRHQLLPILKKDFNPKITDTLNSLATAMQIQRDWIASEMPQYENLLGRSKNSVDIPLKDYQHLHPAIQYQLFRKAIELLNGHCRGLESKHFYEIKDLVYNRPQESIVDLPHGLSAQKIEKNLKFYRTNP